MNNLRKAAEQALETLMWHDETVRTRADSAAIIELRAALAHPEPEPVAYLWQHGETGRTRVIEKDQVWTASNQWNRVGPLYLHPPQRKPLTEEEIYKLFGYGAMAQYNSVPQYAIECVRAIENAHGIGGKP